METHKEFKTILLGYEIEINTDHKNLVHEILLTVSIGVMQFQLIIEGCGPKFHHIPVLNNVIAGVLSRLHTIEEVPDKNSLSTYVQNNTHVQRNERSMSVGRSSNRIGSSEQNVGTFVGLNM